MKSVFTQPAVVGGMMVALAGVTLLPARAAGQTRADYTEHATDLGQSVIFRDDPLAAGGFGANEPILHVRPTAVRMLLVRPRTQFVHELLKSVENL